MSSSQPKKEILGGISVPDIQHTIPEVFIIESLSNKDEAAKRYEGLILAEMLRLSGKNPKYIYFQSPEELPHIIGLFRQSRYRYLHISAHASDDEIATTNRNLSYKQFAKYFEGHLALRRVFMSACQIGNESFLKEMSAKNPGMHSIVAPAEDIQFNHAAAIWSMFYISMFTENGRAMKAIDIRKKFDAIKQLLPVDFFIATYQPKKQSWKYE